MGSPRQLVVNAALIGSLFGLCVTQAGAQATQLEDASEARQQKALEVTPHQRSTVERLLYKLEDDLLIERVLDPPRGFFVRLGPMSEGSGFAIGPAIRYNSPRFDFKTSAAVSTKTYFIGEASLRFPGTLGQDDYFRSHGPYVEFYGRRRDFPQEDFFGLGPDSQSSSRSDFALRDSFGSVTAGYQRGLFKAGTAFGYLDVSTGSGTDARMPSADEVFTIAEMPGAGVPLTFIVIEPFVEFASIDPARGDRSGGRYRASVSQYRDRNLDLYSFRQWEVDLRQYLTFANELRTIALRAWTSSTFPDDGQQVPFYVQPTIGGGHSLRAYRSFRFRDRSALLLQAEYRWRLNEFMHSALFYDTGTVGPSLDDLGRLERSYGFGLRAGGRESSVFRVDVAFGGREGTRLLLRFDDVF